MPELPQNALAVAIRKAIDEGLRHPRCICDRIRELAAMGLLEMLPPLRCSAHDVGPD